MRILLAASTLDQAAGGLPVCVGQLAAALATLGHDVTVVGQAAGEAIAPPDGAVSFRVAVIRRPGTLRGQLQAAGEMATFVRSWLRGGRPGSLPSIVHTHGVWCPPILAAAQAARRLQARLVISPHGMLRREAMRRSRVVKRLVWATRLRRQLSEAAAVHVTSPQEGADLQALLPAIQPVEIPWGIEPLARVSRDAERQATRTAAFLGRMLPIKGLDMLIDAWAMVRPPGWLLRLAGPCDPRMAALLRARIDAQDLAGCVRLEPPVPHAQLGDFLAGTDLFLLPSRSENFGLAAGEALAAGLPVITTTETAWLAVDDIGCGWCVPPEMQAIAAALTAATSRPPAELVTMGRRGTEWIVRDFAWPVIAARLIHAVYRST